MQKLLAAVTVLAVITGGVQVEAAGAEEVFDQGFDPNVSGGLSAGVSAAIQRAQTFTVGTCGNLSRVEVFIRQISPLGVLHFDVRETTSDGVPINDDTQVLADVTLPVTDVPSSSYGFFSFDVSAFEVPVEPGDVLAIVLRTEGGGGNTTIGWKGGNSDPYPDGRLYSRSEAGGFPTWTENPPSQDLGFRTFVFVSEPPCCLFLVNEEVTCHADGSAFTYTVQGVDGCTGGMNTYTFTASGGAVGEEMCFTVLVGDGGFCCSTEICVTVPNCPECHFDGLLVGEVVTDQCPGLAFSSTAGDVTVVGETSFTHTPPNFICAVPNCQDTFIDFTRPVGSLSFWAIGVNDVGTVAQVNVFVDGSFDSTVDVSGLGDPFTPVMVDLASFTNVTRIELGNITDFGGIGWDSFSFNMPAGPPGDLDGDGIVGIADCLALLAAWGSCPDCGNCPGDLDGDCSVGILDLLILLGNWD